MSWSQCLTPLAGPVTPTISRWTTTTPHASQGADRIVPVWAPMLMRYAAQSDQGLRLRLPPHVPNPEQRNARSA